MKLAKSLCCVLLFATLPAPLWASAWQPENTCAVIVGVLKWETKSVASYSPRHRKDQELYDTLLQRGVLKKNVTLLLDEQATLENIRKAVRTIAAQAGPDATFLFYYAGHGTRSSDGKVSFLNYDH